jgi:DNA-binding NarL/FixJ family response regulator
MNFGSQALTELDSVELKRKLRIVLVQEHEVLREGLEILLQKDGEFSVTASFDNSFEALAAIPKLQPDLVITGWELAGQSAAGFLADIRRLAPGCKQLVLSAQESEECVREALQSGADGFIVLFADLTELISAIRSVCVGRPFICNLSATRILTSYFSGSRPVVSPAVSQSITGREREVLVRIALGNSNKAIARELGVSPKTVEKHRSNLMRKLQLHNAAAITMYAIRNGMTGSEPYGMPVQRLAGAN